MSVMKICEAIGVELQNTKEGRKALKVYSNLLDELDDFDKDLFLKSSHRVQWGLHFYTTEAVFGLLKANVENKYLCEQVKRILSNKYKEECVEVTHPIGDFVSNISISVFRNNVQYSLSHQVKATPKLIRLIQDLSVQCQKTKVLQAISKKFQTDLNFKNLISEFDRIHKNIIAPPYSKSDRVIIKKISSLGYSKNDVELVYSFINIMAMIKQTIYDSFMNDIYVIKEESDIISIKEKQVGKLKVIKIKFVPSAESITSQNKWIMRIEKNDGTIMHGQIFSKQIKWTNETFENTAHAVVYTAL